MPNASNIIGEYLYKIGWQVDKLPNIEKSLNTIKFIELAGAIANVTKALYEITKAAVEFTDKVLKADIQTQIFAKRLLTTTQNARSLQSVMGAMGINSLSELRDVALNPTLRAQFLALRKFTQGLEPGKDVQNGLGNLREVSFQLQKINVLLTYFSQYVVGILGKILEPTLKQLTSFLDNFTRDFKARIIPIASQVAFWLGYIFRLFQVWGQIFADVFRVLKEMRVDRWMKVLMAEILVISLYLREIARKMGVEGLTGRGKGTAGAAAIGAAVGGKFGGIPGAAIGAGVGAAYANQDLIEKGFTGLYDERFFGSMGQAIQKWGLKGALWDKPMNHLKNYFVKPSSNDKSMSEPLRRLTLAQAALESGYGKSTLASKYNNYFGIKGKGPAGSVKMWTNEDWGGKRHKILANFRAYHNAEESFKDHLKLLHQPRYSRVLAAASFDEAAMEVKRAGYATDYNYTNLLKSTDRNLQKNPGAINININGYNRDPRELATHVKQTLTTRILQPASP
jgi:hypothetical protein